MIKNDREYRITKSQAEKFERALSEVSASGGGALLHPLVRKAQEDALRSQLLELQEQIAEYEGLLSGSKSSVGRTENRGPEGDGI